MDHGSVKFGPAKNTHYTVHVLDCSLYVLALWYCCLYVCLHLRIPVSFSIVKWIQISQMQVVAST